MAVISGQDYYDISVEVASAREVTLQAKDDMYAAVYKIVLLQVVYPEVDLLNDYWTSYNATMSLYDAPAPLLQAVSSLQSHVLNRGGYDTVDEYVYNEIYAPTGGTLLLPYYWGQLSASAGYTINSLYVQSL